MRARFTLQKSMAMALSCVLVASISVAAAGQTPGVKPPTGRVLVVMDFTTAPLGQLPPGVELLDGTMEVVNKFGTRMLRASSVSSFLVRLPEVLSQDFTLEFDLVPKVSANPEDLAVEGTPTINQGDESTNLLWHSSNVRAIGGGPYFDAPMPEAASVKLAGSPASVVVAMEGTLMKVYANGQLTHTLPNRKFVRSRVLRVLLGGQDDDQQAVYLAGLRVTAYGSSTTVTSGQSVPNASSAQTGIAAGPAGHPSAQKTPPTTTTPLPSVTPPTGAGGTIAQAIPITVIMGAQGPVVSWPPLANATGYAVGRWKIDDPNCCNNSSGRTYGGAFSPWQDQPLPMSGTYVYRVAALTALGEVYGETQFGFRMPGGSTTTTTTGTAIPATQSGSITPMPAATPTSTATAVPVASPTGTMVPATPTLPANAGRYRVTLTGFRASTATIEMPQSADGRGDEVYAAAAVAVWDRSTRTVRARDRVTTKEYGELVNATSYPNRILGGTMTPNGGIWTGNGVEQIPAQYDPSGTTIPAPTNDRFPILVWEGVLTDGIEAVFVIPTLWERDIDPSLYNLWANKWSSASLPQHFLSPPVMVQLGTTQLSSFSLAGPGLPIAVPIPDMTANVRDLPIGIVPNPPIAPVGADYLDRHVIITREKLGALQTVGASTTLPITYNVATTIFASGSYTLYLRIERLQ